MYNELQVGRFNRGIQKLLGMKGPPPMPTVASDLVVIHPLHNGLENQYLEGWDQFYNTQQITALAANPSTYEIRNPLGSNTVAVIESALASENANDPLLLFRQVQGATSATDQPTLPIARALDTRGRSSPTCICSHNNGAAQTALGASSFSIAGIGLLANTQFDFCARKELVLLPGEAYAFVCGVNAQLLLASWHWRERALEDSEQK